MSNKLILGTAQMGLPYGINNTNGKISLSESHAILLEAYQAGIRCLDTAGAYGDAHQVIGSFHEAYPDLLFNVITKFNPGELLIDVEAKVEEYIDELKVSYLDVIMFHSFEDYKKQQVVLSKLKDLKGLGRFRQLGISIYTNSELKALIEDNLIDVIQLPFNLLDNVSIRGELLQKAKQEGKIIHTRSVFLQGLFFMDASMNHPIVSKLRKQLIKINDIARSNDIPVSQLAICYCVQQTNIDRVLMGIDSIEQLKCNIKAVDRGINQVTMMDINQIKIANTNLLNPSLWREKYWL